LSTGIGLGLTKHLGFSAGYQLGSRLSIHGTSDQIVIRLTPGAYGRTGIFVRRGSGAQGASAFYLWFSGLQESVGAFANLIDDAGGFGVGSQLTWQLYTGVGKQFK